MTPLQIKYFLSVATTKSITKSAQELYVSVSAIGKQLVALEKEIGVVLLNRSNRGTELTEAGIEFFAFFSRTNAEYAALRKKFKDVQTPPSRFRLGMLADWQIWHILRQAERLLSDKDQHYSLEIMPLSVPELMKGLEDSSLDAVLCPSTGPSRPLGKRRVIVQELLTNIDKVLVYLPEAFPDIPAQPQPADFADKILYTPSNHSQHMIVEENCLICTHYGFQPKLRICHTLPQAMAAVRLGKGFAIVDEWSSYCHDGLLQQISLELQHGVSLFWPSRRHNPLVSLLASTLKDLLPQETGIS